MNFETALREQIESRPKLGLRGKRILAILDAKPSKRRTRRIERMERHAAVAAGFTNTVGIDWSQIDWKKLFDTILELLLKFLPLILAL